MDPIKKDILSKDDLHFLVKSFYQKATVDPVIGHFFTKVMQLDLETHIPKISNFWASVLFGDTIYQGNPMVKHIALNRKSPMKTEHFDRWIELWLGTTDDLFEGENAEMIKKRALGIRQLMEFKVGHVF